MFFTCSTDEPSAGMTFSICTFKSSHLLLSGNLDSESFQINGIFYHLNFGLFMNLSFSLTFTISLKVISQGNFLSCMHWKF